MKKVPLILCGFAMTMVLFLSLYFVFRNQGTGMVRISAYTPPTVCTVPAETISYPININTADVSALMTLPGIGETYAQRIVEYRTEHGDFVCVSDLLSVPGIGKKRLDGILEFITTGGSDEDTGC